MPKNNKVNNTLKHRKAEKQKLFNKLMRSRKCALAATLVHCMQDCIPFPPSSFEIEQFVELYDMQVRNMPESEIKAKAKEYGVKLS
jgi:hypothetical protein